MSRRPRYNLGQLPGPERDRFRRVCGLLARPRLEEAHRAALRELAGAEWRPLPRLSTTYTLEPLLIHHWMQAGLGARELFEPAGEGEPPTASFASLASNYFLRRKILTEVFAQFAARGVSRVVLIKGVALASLYPSPALRDMEDADIVIGPDDVAAASAALREAGWTQRDQSWAHPSGCLIDLQTDSGQGWLEKPVAHPTFGGNVFMPSPVEHVLLLGKHCAQHYGLRVWRDICDLNLLLDNGRERAIAGEALELAAQRGVEAPLAAIYRLMNKWCEPVERLPERESAAEALHFDLFEQLMTDRISEFGFVSMANLLVGPGQWARSASRAASGILKRKVLGVKPAGPHSQRDPQFGHVPAVDTFGRQMMKFQFLFETIRTGHFGHYRRLLKETRRINRGRKAFVVAKDSA